MKEGLTATWAGDVRYRSLDLKNGGVFKFVWRLGIKTGGMGVLRHV